MAVTERQALAILGVEFSSLGARSSSWMPLGIGDDAAVLAPRGERLVWTTDACNEGAHFLFDWLTPEELAHKSFHAAASDVAAMGARLRAINCQLTLSPRVTRAYLRRFFREQVYQCRRHGAVVSGGNLTMGTQVEVVVSVLGTLKAHSGTGLRRDQARPGDELWLVGDVGLAHLGWRLLEAGRSRTRTPALLSCLKAFRRPEAQLRAGPRLLGRARAALDLSDGLLRDSQNLAQASGVALRLDLSLLEAVLSPELVEAATVMGVDPRAAAMLGGEDYALLCAGAAARRPGTARRLGWVERGSGVSLDCSTASRAEVFGRNLDQLAGNAVGRRRGSVLRLRGGFQHE